MALFSSMTWADLAVIFLLSALTYYVALIVYRLWFHPIADFPGPFLARTTFWYEFYYSYVRVGAYYLKVKEMHEKYGPIVRITPDELHINEPMFFHEVFVSSAVRKTNNYPRAGDGTGFEDMTAVSSTHNMHRASRAPLDPFFSKAGVLKLEQRVLARIEKMCARLRLIQGTGQVVNLFNAISSLTTDAVSSIIFEEPSDYLGDSDFNEAWFCNLRQGTLSVPIFAQLPWIARLFASPIMKYLLEKATGWRVWDDASKARRQILKTRLRPSDEAKTREDTTVFDHLVHSELTEAQFGRGGFTRLAQLLQQAGTYNVSHTLCTIITYLLLDETKSKIFRAEIETAFAGSPNNAPTWRDLEKLPYLTASIKEGLRMAIGAMNRSARVFPDVTLKFREWIIPKGTPVSMSSYWMHNDPSIFPEPHKFLPERWLCDPEKLKRMNNYFVPFSRGSRNCMAQNFVYMQMYHTLAQLFRHGAPEIVLFETDESDVIPVHGMLFPLPKLSSKGVRVTIQ